MGLETITAGIAGLGSLAGGGASLAQATKGQQQPMAPFTPPQMPAAPAPGPMPQVSAPQMGGSSSLLEMLNQMSQQRRGF